MPWNSTVVDGSNSVASNETSINQNTTYIENTMGNTANDTTNTSAIRDHYWNVSSDFDGRHRFINMPKFTIGGTATDPEIGTLMDGVFYLKEDSFITTSPKNELFFRNTVGVKKVSEPFNMVAAGFITSATGTPVRTLEYNVASVTNSDTGEWTVTFDKALDDAEYMVQATHGGGGGLFMVVPQSLLTDSSFKILAFNTSNVQTDTTSFSFQVYK